MVTKVKVMGMPDEPNKNMTIPELTKWCVNEKDKVWKSYVLIGRACRMVKEKMNDHGSFTKWKELFLESFPEEDRPSMGSLNRWMHIDKIGVNAYKKELKDKKAEKESAAKKGTVVTPATVTATPTTVATPAPIPEGKGDDEIEQDEKDEEMEKYLDREEKKHNEDEAEKRETPDVPPKPPASVRSSVTPPAISQKKDKRSSWASDEAYYESVFLTAKKLIADLNKELRYAELLDAVKENPQQMLDNIGSPLGLLIQAMSPYIIASKEVSEKKEKDNK